MYRPTRSHPSPSSLVIPRHHSHPVGRPALVGMVQTQSVVQGSR